MIDEPASVAIAALALESRKVTTELPAWSKFIQLPDPLHGSDVVSPRLPTLIAAVGPITKPPGL